MLRRYLIFFPGENIVTEKSRQVDIILSGSLAGFMVLLDGNIVNIALPAIGRYFNIGTTQVVQITVVYLLVLAVLSLSLFIYNEMKHRNPLLDPGMFRDRNFTLGIMASIMGYGLMAETACWRWSQCSPFACRSPLSPRRRN